MAANAITLSGNLTKDPELREVETSKGSKKVVSFRIGVNDAGNKQDDTGFFNCVAWEPLAPNLKRSLQRGQRVIVTGQLRHREFKADDGSTRSAIEILVTDAGPSVLFATTEATQPVAAAESPGIQAAPEPVGA